MSLTKNEIKFVKSLHQKKNREIHKLFIVEGEKLIDELLKQGDYKVERIYHTHDYELPHTIDHNLFQLISNQDLSRISNLKTPNKVLATVQFKTPKPLDYTADNLILILDEIKDPGNMGTIIRTANWFGVKQIVCSENCVDLYNPKCIQASMGAIYKSQVHYCPLQNTIDQLKSNHFNIVGASLDGENMYHSTFSPKTALVMGSESHGISQSTEPLIDKNILIPQYGTAESLNVGIATGIILAEYKRQVN